MAKVVIWVLITYFFVSGIFGMCEQDEKDKQLAKNYNSSINVYASDADAADGLDLKAVAELLKTTKTAQEFERRLNSRGGINNLDLNADGKVDYIQVKEYGDDKVKGFSLLTEPEKGAVQEVASIEIEKQEKKADVRVRGNEQIYGPNHYYRGGFGLTDFLLISWLFSPHVPYYSPYGFGYYPPYYGYGYGRMSPYQYRNRVNNYTKRSSLKSSTTLPKSSVSSPYRNRSAASGIKAKLRKPTMTQKSFRKRTVSSKPRSGGFGRNKSSSGKSFRGGGFGRSSFGGFGK